MNILMVNPKMSVGGAERIMLTLSRGFREAGDRVVVAAESGTFDQDFREAGADLVRLPLDQDRKNLFQVPGLMARLRRICREREIEIIHSHHRWTTFLAGFAAKSLNIPLVFHCHSRIQGKKRLTSWGDQVIAVSEDLRRYLIDDFHVRPDRIRTVSNAVPDPVCRDRDVERERKAIRSFFGEGWTGPLIGTAGRLVKEKGFDILISAVPLILRDHPECRFLIIGKGEKEDELKALSEKNGVAGNVLFLGERTDPIPAVHLLDVFFLHSYTEGSSVSSLEAMSLGKPVVATSVGGVLEIVVHLENGLLVPPGDPAALAAAVGRLLDDPGLAARLAAAGRAGVQTRFRAERMVENVRTIFAELAAGKRRRTEQPLPTRRNRADLPGVSIDNLDMAGALAEIERLMAGGGPALVVTPNVQHINLIRKDADFRAAYASASLVLPDSVPLIWLSRLLGRRLKARVAGSDILPAFCPLAAAKGYRPFLMGSMPGVAARAAEILEKANPGLTMAGVFSPPLDFEQSAEECRKTIAAVRSACPDALFIGLGSPKGEIWASQNLEAMGVPATICVGAAFDFITGRLRRAPQWMQKAGLEWFFRLIQEPRRMWRRYILGNAEFLVFLVRWMIEGRPRK
ncbi:MAG: WecB/TagA/CpsF family glycosyltransferase [Acidobacteriota bacterium]|nr:WecB/TagA/CpsF family glycosyltransferase [Acidobacteriota bacterium]